MDRDERNGIEAGADGSVTPIEGHKETAIMPSAAPRSRPVPIGDMQEAEIYLKTLIRDVMVKDLHYGSVPGIPKMFPWKPAFEVLLDAYKMVPRHRIQKTNLNGGHREYEVVTELYDSETGAFVCSGVGMASSEEPRYKYTVCPVEFTGEPIPNEYWNSRKRDPKAAQKLIGGPGHVAAKNPDTGLWEIAIRGDRVEVQDPADKFNTVLKQAKKRSLADATLTATKASGYFSPDLIDEPDERGAYGIDDDEFPPSDNVGQQTRGATGNGQTNGNRKPPQRRQKQKTGSISEDAAANAEITQDNVETPVWELWELIMGATGGDIEAATTELERATSFQGNRGPVPGIRRLENLNERRAGASLGRLRKEMGIGYHGPDLPDASPR